MMQKIMKQLDILPLACWMVHPFVTAVAGPWLKWYTHTIDIVHCCKLFIHYNATWLLVYSYKSHRHTLCSCLSQRVPRQFLEAALWARAAKLPLGTIPPFRLASALMILATASGLIGVRLQRHPFLKRQTFLWFASPCLAVSLIRVAASLPFSMLPPFCLARRLWISDTCFMERAFPPLYL